MAGAGAGAPGSWAVPGPIDEAHPTPSSPRPLTQRRPPPPPCIASLTDGDVPLKPIEPCGAHYRRKQVLVGGHVGQPQLHARGSAWHTHQRRAVVACPRGRRRRPRGTGGGRPAGKRAGMVCVCVREVAPEVVEQHESEQGGGRRKESVTWACGAARC
eukprot:scaffold13528_cov126-Isochrysis_galbana.AAC.9